MKQNPTKVLIADDETSITSGLSAILADEGYNVDVANDGQKALERLNADRYGVILADSESYLSVVPDWEPTLPSRGDRFRLVDLLAPECPAERRRD